MTRSLRDLIGIKVDLFTITGVDLHYNIPAACFKDLGATFRSGLCDFSRLENGTFYMTLHYRQAGVVLRDFGSYFLLHYMQTYFEPTFHNLHVKHGLIVAL